MKVAICSKHSTFEFSEIDDFRKIYNFNISKSLLSITDIFDSGFSTPARYVMEMFVRVTRYLDVEINKKTQPILIFNPLYEFLGWEISLTLIELKKYEAKNNIIIILSDKNNIPIAYYFAEPEIIINKERYLTLMSTVDSALDSKYLENILNCEIKIIKISSIHLNLKTNHNGFYFDSRFVNVYRFSTEKAIYSLNNFNRDKISFAIIMPFHAGDVLFLSLASKRKGCIFSHLVVWERYADIPKEVNAKLEIISLKTTPPFIGDSKLINDIDYIIDAYKRELKKNNLYYYGRPTREYSITEFHLIDHFAFALGNNCISENDLYINKKTLLPVSLLSNNNKNIFLHFDGGWSLKVYPKAWQDELINMLTDDGFNVTVLCDKKGVSYTNIKCKKVSFTNLETLKNLLNSNNIVVGMDSFPAHFATHVLRVPTICLFSNTKPCNSNDKKSKSYAYIHENNCDPCYSRYKCGKKFDYCINFQNPQIVFRSIISMYEELYLNNSYIDCEQQVDKISYIKINKMPVLIKTKISFIYIYVAFFSLFFAYLVKKNIIFAKTLVRWIKTKGVKITLKKIYFSLTKNYSA